MCLARRGGVKSAQPKVVGTVAGHGAVYEAPKDSSGRRRVSLVDTARRSCFQGQKQEWTGARDSCSGDKLVNG
jgi:hypothetical protein